MNQNSYEAYESIRPEKLRLHRKILGALNRIQKGSFRDIAKQAKLKDAQVWRRLSELEKADQIEKVGDKICPISGRHVSVYQLKNQ